MRLGAWAMLLLLFVASTASAQRPQWVLYDTARTSATRLQQQLRATGADVRYASKLVNAISVDADAAELRRIAA